MVQLRAKTVCKIFVNTELPQLYTANEVRIWCKQSLSAQISVSDFIIPDQTYIPTVGEKYELVEYANIEEFSDKQTRLLSAYNDRCVPLGVFGVLLLLNKPEVLQPGLEYMVLQSYDHADSVISVARSLFGGDIWIQTWCDDIFATDQPMVGFVPIK